jgi:uncharacterized membrane protein YdjX (TVP38/TMEM64 family)
MSNESHKKIHKKLRQHSPKGVKKAKKLFSFGYVKLFLFVGLMVLAYFLFSSPFISDWIKSNNFGNLGVLVSGALTSTGFTATLGVGLLTKMNVQNILIAALIGGVGAAIADLILFKSIKFSFKDEIKKLKKMKIIKEIENIAKKNKNVLIRHYLMYVFAGILLVIPLPDELAVSMFAGLTTVKSLKFGLISFVIHASTIFFILYII